jgi:hypothetical protein
MTPMGRLQKEGHFPAVRYAAAFFGFFTAAQRLRWAAAIRFLTAALLLRLGGA